MDAFEAVVNAGTILVMLMQRLVLVYQTILNRRRHARDRLLRYEMDLGLSTREGDLLYGNGSAADNSGRLTASLRNISHDLQYPCSPFRWQVLQKSPYSACSYHLIFP